MTVESAQDLAQLQKIGEIVAHTLETLRTAVQPGMTTAEVDAIAGDLLSAAGAESAPWITYRFPGNICISINDEATHGIPGKRVIRPGDIVKIDLSAARTGYFADAAVTIAVPPTSTATTALIDCARAALDAGCAAAVAGAPFSQVGRAVQQVARRSGFSVIAELTAHGVGRGLHEEPSYIPMVYDPRDKRILRAGQVITIEPHIAAGKGHIYTAKDGWTLRTKDRSPVAQFEHTIVVTSGAPIFVTVTSPPASLL